MIPFFSPRNHRKEQIAGRALVIAAALLFLAAALLGTLPSRDRLFTILEESGLAGYERGSETTPSRSRELEEFYDRPLTEKENSPSQEAPSDAPAEPTGSDLAEL